MTLLGTVGFLPAVLRHVLLLLLISGCVVLFLMDRHYAMKNEVEILLSRIADLREEQEKLNLFRHNLARGLNDTVAIMKAQIEHIENLQQISKRKNLKFFGVPESRVAEDPEQLVKKLIEDALQTTLGDDVIDDAFRLHDETFPRPILVQFVRWKDRTQIFRKRKAFPVHIRINEDLTELQEKTRIKLEKFAEKAEKDGKKVRWNGKQLLVNEQIVKL